VLAVSRDTLGIAEGDAFDIEFRWADSFQAEDDIDAFTVNGDSAPLGRFNCRCHTGPRR